MTATPSYESIADVEAAAQKMRDFFDRRHAGRRLPPPGARETEGVPQGE